VFPLFPSLPASPLPQVLPLTGKTSRLYKACLYRELFFTSLRHPGRPPLPAKVLSVIPLIGSTLPSSFPSQLFDPGTVRFTHGHKMVCHLRSWPTFYPILRSFPFCHHSRSTTAFSYFFFLRSSTGPAAPCDRTQSRHILTLLAHSSSE